MTKFRKHILQTKFGVRFLNNQDSRSSFTLSAAVRFLPKIRCAHLPTTSTFSWSVDYQQLYGIPLNASHSTSPASGQLALHNAHAFLLHRTRCFSLLLPLDYFRFWPRLFDFCRQYHCFSGLQLSLFLLPPSNPQQKRGLSATCN